MVKKTFKRKKADYASGILFRFGIVDVLIYMLLFFFSLSVLYPFWDMLMRSLSTPSAISSKVFTLFPRTLTFDSYRAVFSTNTLLVNYYNSIFRTVVGTALSLLVSTCAAFALSKKGLPGRTGLTVYLIITMFFSGGLIPTFLLIKNIGLYDTIWSLIIPLVANVYNMVIIRNSIQSLDRSMEESAMIDGANQFVILFRLVIPVSAPVLATVGLWCMVAHWNSWYDALLYTNKPSLEVLQLALRKMMLSTSGGTEFFSLMAVSENQHKFFTPETIKAAQTLVTMVPILLTYPFLQRYFIKGIMIGSLKG